MLVLTVFGNVARSAPAIPPSATQPGPAPVLSPATISALAARLNADIAAAAAPAQPYAVIARFLQTNITSRGQASAGAIASVVLAAATLPGARIRDVDLGDGLAHAAVSFGVTSDAARNIAGAVGRDATRPVRNYFAEITKALTGVTTLADIANNAINGVGDISNGNGLGFTLTPSLPNAATCLNPSCTQL
jgi:hypothetical protein